MIKDVNIKKLNNKGFTLIEVIIAMTVLVIVSVPMLDTLSGSTTVTRKSSNRQRATMLAQSISEGVKRYSTKQLCKAFVDYSNVDEFKILSSDNYTFEGYNRLKKDASGILRPVTRSESKDVQENAKEYFYEIVGIETGIEKYDALITLDSDVYKDLNGEVIPEIVNIGAPGTAFVDITGIFHGEDIIGDLKKEIESDSDYNPNRETFSTDRLSADVQIYIIKDERPAADGSGNIEIAYQVYGNVKYEYTYGNRNTHTFVRKYLGNRTLDEVQKLNYVYVLLGDDNLYNVNGVKNNIDFIVDVDSSENIPVAIVTGNKTEVTWEMTVRNSAGNNEWRKAVTFFTNGTNDKITYRNRVLGEVIQDYGSSGNKLKRIYDLKVALYHHKTDPATRYQGDPIDIITSSYLRIDVNDFNDIESRDE